MMIRTLIVDDEDACVDLLKFFIGAGHQQVEIVGTANTVEEAYKAIQMYRPNLLLLDISMPPSDGFALLRKFDVLPFEVVFTTAYNQYALDAIKFSATDYLLKPIDPAELKISLQKVERRLDLYNKEQRRPRKIFLPCDRSYLLVNPEEIVRVSMESKSTTVFLKTKKNVEVHKHLNDLENILGGSIFFRSHRSHIINLDEVNEYIPGKHGGCVIMSDGKIVPVAERRKDAFLMIYRG